MATVPRTDACTFDDFCLLVPEGQKADLIDGVIYVASPDNTDAGDLFGWLFNLLYLYIRRKDLGKLYALRIAFRVNERNSPEPDLAFVRKDREHLIERGFVNGPPDLAVEIVSPDSVERDYEQKRKQYQQAGVPEYWIIDEMDRSVTLLRLAATKKYREVKPRKGILHSEVLEGFWFRPEWLWQEPQPDPLDTLQQVLGEQT
jgi:Uma2 family endonuclease